MKLTSLQILQCARELISDPKHWTKEATARDKYGEPTWPHSKLSCSYCMLGAVEKCAAQNFREEATAVAYLNRAIPTKAGYIANYNDAPRRKHSQVLRVFDKAIKLAEKE